MWGTLYFSFKTYITTCFLIIVYLCSAVIPVALFLQVVFRYIFKRPLLGVEEVAIAALIMLVIFGSAIVFREKQHILVDALIQHLSPRLQHLASMICDIFTGIILVFLMKSCLVALPFQEVYRSVILGIPKSVYTIVFLVNLIFMFICSFESFVRNVWSWKGAHGKPEAH
jgi:TRAP-type C4-dicarboxylate transport system permease small subunit